MYSLPVQGANGVPDPETVVAAVVETDASTDAAALVRTFEGASSRAHDYSFRYAIAIPDPASES